MEYFTIKQLLFGLRNEYVESQKKLQRIRDCIIKSEDNIEYDIYYDVDIQNEIYSLICEINNQKKLMEKIVSYLSAPRLSEYTFKGTKFQTYKLSFRENNHPTERIAVNYDRLLILHDRVEDILSSEFGKYMILPYFYDKENNTDLLLNQNFISTAVYEGSKIPPASVFYKPKKDAIEMLGFYDYIVENDIHRMMNIKIPADKLNSYIISTIKNHNVKDKDLIIDGLKNVREKQSFSIDEQEKTIKLTKKM